ncbi:MAG TPA: secretin N-terminal domain-containing protein [Caldimonas sp.]|nr:secretin N-terminal domain-containing protein [Caldimonas sp.]
MRRPPIEPLRHGALAWLVAAVLSACAPGTELTRDAQQLIEQGQPEEGLARLEEALQRDPGNMELRILIVRQRAAAVASFISAGDGALRDGRLDEAESAYRRAQALDAQNARAHAGLDLVASVRRQQRRVDEARALLAKGKADEAQQRIEQVLAENPANPAALALKRRLDLERPPLAEPQPTLRAALRKPVTLDFRNADLRAVFEALSRTTGVNFVFDREVRPDIKVTLTIQNLGIEDVIGILATANQLERKTLNDNTVLIYPNTPAKQKEYLDLRVKTFYLANTDAKSMLTMLKTVLKTRDVYADEKLNTLTMRDTGDAIRLAEKLIATQDLSEPEVMLELEVLEVKRSHLTNLGISPPTQFTVLNIVPNPTTVINTATGQTAVVNNTTTTTQLTLNQLRGLHSSSIGIDNPSLNLRAERGDTNLLANPRIRVKNHDKARVLIGDRVPVITTTTTANVGISESVSYLDVGLKLDVEPTVFLDDDVGVKVSLEVSSIVREVRSNTGSLTYQIGTRVATTNLRLHDGETQALAGLISDEDRRSAAGWPGAVDLPVAGRLFSTETVDRSKTELVLLVTPRVVRNLPIIGPARSEMAGGTEAQPGASPLRLSSPGRMTMSASGGPPSPAAPARQEPEEPAEATPEPPKPPAPAPSAPASSASAPS